MPTPVSSTVSTANPLSRLTRIVMVPPAGVYLSALETRLLMICSMRITSASTQTGVVSRFTTCSCILPVARRLVT